MKIVRIVILALIVVVAGVVAIGAVSSSEEASSSDTYSTAISGALLDYQVNNDNAESAPQQQVVNGWVAKDLLTVIARQNIEVINGQDRMNDQLQRTNTLLQAGLIVLFLGLLTGVVAVALQTRPRSSGDDDQASAPTPASSGTPSTAPTAETSQ